MCVCVYTYIYTYAYTYAYIHIHFINIYVCRDIVACTSMPRAATPSAPAPEESIEARAMLSLPALLQSKTSAHGGPNHA